MNRAFDPVKNDEFCVALLESSNKEDLFEWLSRDDGIERTVGEYATNEESRSFAGRLRSAGASVVWIVDIERATDDYKAENGGKLCVPLPADEAQRRQLLKIANDFAEAQGFDAVPDEGQRYLYIGLD